MLHNGRFKEIIEEQLFERLAPLDRGRDRKLVAFFERREIK
jgi:hypothetical protein